MEIWTVLEGGQDQLPIDATCLEPFVGFARIK